MILVRRGESERSKMVKVDSSAETERSLVKVDRQVDTVYKKSINEMKHA